MLERGLGSRVVAERSTQAPSVRAGAQGPTALTRAGWCGGSRFSVGWDQRRGCVLARGVEEQQIRDADHLEQAADGTGRADDRELAVLASQPRSARPQARRSWVPFAVDSSPAATMSAQARPSAARAGSSAIFSP